MFLDTKSQRTLQRRLLAWYKSHARDLPWRRRRDAYAIWVSEIMLQQTQVETVKGYFDRFLKALPTIDALAKAEEQQVLRLWEGLGYYRRARQLHKAAQILVEEHQGEFPTDPQIVRRLPGIGRYTSGAVLSIAFGARQPILEANTLRLFSRLLAYDGDPRSTEGQQMLWAFAEEILPKRDVGRFNQALMEVGSLICTVREPACGECPLATVCRANEQQRQNVIPHPPKKRATEAVREAAVVVRHRGRVLLLRWPKGYRWAGLWDFPRFPIYSEHPEKLCEELAENVRALTGVAIELGPSIANFSHCVTRFRISLACYTAIRSSLNNKGASRKIDEIQWVSPAVLGDYALNSTGRKIADLVFGADRN
jgi:A/G-specific adenine glycosylase